MDSAVSKTTRTFGFRVSAMFFTVCKGYASACTTAGNDHVVAKSANPRHNRRNAADGTDIMVGSL
jgi:hypothetical protein